MATTFPRILTVTPNPSVDLLFEAEHLAWDDANRLPDPRRRPGGQGINVARAVRELGGHALAVTLVGGRTGIELIDHLTAEGTAVVAVEADAETRTFVAVRDHGSGRSLLLNARGPLRTAADAAGLLAAIEKALVEYTPHWVACCGSIPRGFPDTFHAAVARMAVDAGCRVVVDCDGASLAAAADLADLLVPNQHEAERLSRLPVSRDPGALQVAHRLRSAPSHSPVRPRNVAVTLGDAGAVLATGNGGWLARARVLPSGSAVGAGDAFLAGLLLRNDLDSDPAGALKRGVAAGTAVLLSSGSGLLTREEAGRQLRSVTCERVD